MSTFLHTLNLECPSFIHTHVSKCKHYYNREKSFKFPHGSFTRWIDLATFQQIKQVTVYQKGVEIHLGAMALNFIWFVKFILLLYDLRSHFPVRN